MRHNIVEYLNFIFETWVVSWCGVLGMLISAREAFAAPGAEQRFRECFREAGTDLVLAHTIRIAYAIPANIFGTRIFSLRSVFRSALCSIFTFFAFLGIAYVTTPESGHLPQNNGPLVSNIVSQYVRMLQLSEIFSGAPLRVYTGLIISFTATFVFEFICLSKSRLFLRSIRVNMTNAKVITLFLADVAATITLFISTYSLVWAFSTVALSVNYSLNLGYLHMTTSGTPELLRLLKPDTIAGWMKVIVSLMENDAVYIIYSIISEVRSGFDSFIVIKQSWPEDSYGTILHQMLSTRPSELAYLVIHDPRNRLLNSYADIPMFYLPLSTVFATALFTNVWITIVVATLLAARLICKVSSRWRMMIIRCCQSDHLIWNRAIMPSIVICIIGIVVISVAYVFSL